MYTYQYIALGLMLIAVAVFDQGWHRSQVHHPSPGEKCG
jgi:hypothetical protein